MSIRQEILNTPEAIRTTLEKGRPEFETVIRQTRWSGRPVFMVGSGASYAVALAGARAFESLLGSPVVVCPSAEFSAYSIAAIERRSVLLVVSQSGESAGSIQAAQAARQRGAVVLAVTGGATSSLARLAAGAFLVRAGEEPEPRARTILCQLAALSAVAVLATRILKRPDAQVGAIEEEIWGLPSQIDWVLTQLQDGARSLAARIKDAKDLTIAGAGFDHPTALLAARFLGKLSATPACCLEPQDLEQGPAAARRSSDSALLVLSGSRAGMKEALRSLALNWRMAGGQVLAVTDSADRELAGEASLAVLLPALGEMAGSILRLAALFWTAYEISRSHATSPATGGRRERSGATKPQP